MYKGETEKPNLLSNCANFRSMAFNVFFCHFSNGGTAIQSILSPYVKTLGNYRFINKFLIIWLTVSLNRTKYYCVWNLADGAFILVDLVITGATKHWQN